MADTDSLRFCESCKSVTLWKFGKFIGHSRCTCCGSPFSRYPLQTDKSLERMKRLHPRLKFAGRKISEPRNNFAHGYAMITTNELDDELDKVSE